MEKTILFKGQTIHYDFVTPGIEKSKSAAAQLMLVHGFPERGHIFQRQIAALADHFTLLIPDLPGSGNSPYNALLSTTSDFADGLLAALDAEQIDKIVLIGHSMGGYIALAFAQKYPERLSGLGLLHSTAYSDSDEKKANRLKAIQTMEKYGGPAFLKPMIPTLFGQAFKAKHPEFIRDMIESGNNFETRALQQYYQMMHDRKDKTAVIAQLRKPILFISGTEDKAAPAADLMTQASLVDKAMIEILDGAGHMGFIEKSDQVNAIIKDFLAMVHQMS